MFSAKKSKFLSSLSVRHAFWSVLVFSISLISVLTAFYYISKSYLFRAVDGSVRYELEESLHLFKTKGFEAMPAHINAEAEEYNPSRVFYRIISKNSEVLAASDLSSWQGLERERLSKSGEEARIIKLAGDKEFARIVTLPLNSDLHIEGGIKLNNEMEILGLYKLLLPIVGLIIIFLAAATSYIILRRAMQRVDEITNLANSISASQLNSRLPVGSVDDEISRLSETFNKMLQRIEGLVKGMKNVTDDIAHDLRAPITSMRSRAELALNNSNLIEDPISEAANSIEECDRLLNLLNSMLDISEAEAKIVNLKKEKLDLDELLKTAVELFEPVAEQKAVSITYSGTPDAYIVGDLPKLQRALSNIIDNAVKYSQTGGRVEVALEKQGDSSLKISIIDNGIGMSDDELPLIYERFYRADTSRSGIGNGLGLTMSKALIEAHGGTISVVSKKNAGTAVTVTFPNV